MDAYSIVILILIGALAGSISAFMGIGGGLIIIPLLVLLLNYSQKAAQGTSLAILSIPVTLIATINYYKTGYVNISHVLIMAAGFVIASYFASKYALSLPDVYLKKVFAVFLILYAIKLLWEK